MRIVILASPFAGDTERNIDYARRCLLDCLMRGEAPLATHLLYTQVLDDTLPEERRLGTAAARAWIPRVDAVVVYTDLGISAGMRNEISDATIKGIRVEYRRLAGWPG